MSDEKKKHVHTEDCDHDHDGHDHDHGHHGHVHGPGCNHDHTPQKPVVRSEPKVGRNDPCTCGSGKKFKKCCGA